MCIDTLKRNCNHDASVRWPAISSQKNSTADANFRSQLWAEERQKEDADFCKKLLLALQFGFEPGDTKISSRIRQKNYGWHTDQYWAALSM